MSLATGQKDEARKWYDKAIEWTEKNQTKNMQLRGFRIEAEELLKTDDSEPTTKEKSTTTKTESK